MIEITSKILWGIATIFIMMGGIYFTIKLRGIQFDFINVIRSLFSKKENNAELITAKESLLMTLAARIGVGSIAGIALSIYIGGVGTIFWIWISTIIIVPNSFVETVLGIIYQQKDKKNSYIGGPSYYIKKGLNSNFLAMMYAFIIIATYIFGFLPIQSNTITKAILQISNIDSLHIGIIVSILSGLVIFSGIKGIVKTTNKIVPIMGLGYCLMATYIIIVNINILPNIFLDIISSAINIKSGVTGILTTIIIGIQRGIFSNESGLGTGAIASSITKTDNPFSVGLAQIFGVYFTSLIICSASAIIILTSDYNTLVISDINGIELALYAFNYHLGFLGEILLIATILLFAFSTIITGYYYGESNLKFLTSYMSRKKFTIFRFLTLFLILLGSIGSSLLLWKIVDILVALLAIVNMYALLKLRNVIVKYWYKHNKCKNL
jgi:alanine or glycine:cation symporter, AGCS family